VVCSRCGTENPEGAKFCNECAAPLAETAPSSALDERKLVSVLFCDLVGFTAASEQQDPEDVRARIRPYHARVRQEIERYGGTVEKFVGDAVMAVCGAPVAHEDDAERAVRAGLSILDAIADLNEANPDLQLQVRVGINTGEAVVAVGARPEQGEGIVTGDVVNTAARIQSAAPVSGVAVSEQTYRATSRVFEYEPLAQVSVKGKAEPLALFRALAARARFGSDVTRTHVTPLVGRELEKSLLIGTFERAAQQRSCQLVTIVGEPGVGKSRLSAELFHYIDDRPGLVRWRQGRCLPYGEGIAFWALGEIVKAECGILESDSPDQAGRKLDRALAADDPDRAWLRTRLAPLVGAGGEPAEREESFTAWRRFCESLASDDPAVLVFEDLHWADTALLSFVEHLADWSEGFPLLLLCMSRPELFEQQPTWAAGLRNAQTINLAPLSDEETARLISSLLRRAVLPADTQRSLLERAGGNPLYAEEFVRLLADRDLLTGPLADVPLPDSVQALIAARLDTLSPDRKSLLQDAAVVGKVFWAGALAAIGDRDLREVEQALHELVRKELVRPARTSSMEGEQEYGFWHLLVRDVCYAQIPRAARAARHRSAAAWIEEKAGERVEDLADVLAHHYVEALELVRASGAEVEGRKLAGPTCRFLIMAGDRALHLDVARAEQYHQRALELLDAGDPQRSRVLAKTAEVLHLEGRFTEAERTSGEAIAAFEAQDDLRGAGDAMVWLASSLRLRGETSRAQSVLAQAVELLEREPPGRELVFAYANAARDHMMAGRFAECLDWSQKAIALADAFELHGQSVRLRQFRGWARFGLGDLGGLDDESEALRLGLELGLGAETAFAYLNVSDLTWFAKDVAGALEGIETAIDFAERRGINTVVMWCRGMRLWYLFDTGEWTDLVRAADELLEWDHARGDSQIGIMALSYKARVLVRRGAVAEAASLQEELLARARESGDPQVLGPALHSAALIEQAAGHLASARRLVEEYARAPSLLGSPPHFALGLPDALRICAATDSLDLAERLLQASEHPSARARHSLLNARAILAEARGKPDEAASLNAQAAEAWCEFGNVPEHARALLGQGRCLVTLGRPGAAKPLREARGLFASLDDRNALAETEALLEQTAAASAS
jgi:class 3 adenylate cyclase/tetratricopeptide (TPR) repeat protein